MAELLGAFYATHRNSRVRLLAFVQAVYNIMPCDFASLVSDLATKFDAGEYIPPGAPQFVWHLLVVLLSLPGCTMALLREQALSCVDEIDVARASVYLGMSADPSTLRTVAPVAHRTVTLLHLASSVEAALACLEHTDIETRDHCGLTPLHRAALRGKSDVVELLLERGADWRALSDQGQSVMHMAARASDMRTVDLLLRAGASLTDRGLVHCALHSGAPARSIELLCERIVAASGDVNGVCREYGETALQLAAREPELIGVLRVLLTSERLDRSPDIIVQAIRVAARNNNGPALTELLPLAPVVPHRGQVATAIFNEAALRGHAAIVEQLLQAGMRPRDDYAHYVETTTIDVLRVLLRWGFDVNVTQLMNKELEATGCPSHAWINDLHYFASSAIGSIDYQTVLAMLAITPT